MFYGSNLRNLRLLNCFSLADLSKLSGIGEFDLWSYENNFKEPVFEHINILKNLFKVKSLYFYQSDLLSEFDSDSNLNIDYISLRYD